jgi:hypothetical protein
MDNMDNIKDNIKDLKKLIKVYDNNLDFNQIEYSTLVGFLLKSLKKLDERLDVLEAKVLV